MVCEAFVAVCELGIALGIKPLNEHNGCWEIDIDSKWSIAVNGHSEDVVASNGNNVPTMSCAVTYNGWPAGVFNPGGGIIAAGDAANEKTFLAAVRKRTTECDAMRSN